MISFKNKISFYLLLLFVLSVQSQTSDVPFTVNSLFSNDQPETLGLSFAKGTETFTIFSPKNNENKYNHGVVLFPFKGMLYAQWQRSSVDEDGLDTQVFFTAKAPTEKIGLSQLH